MNTELSASLPQADKRPLPLLVAEKWDFPLQHYLRFDVKGGYLYALQDWARGLFGQSAEQGLKDFRKSKSRIQLVDDFYKLPYKAPMDVPIKWIFVQIKVYIFLPNIYV